MTTAVGVREARARLSDLLKRVAKGEEIAITRRGQEVARLVPSPMAVRPRRKGGWLKGAVWIADDFDDTPEALIDLMEGKDEEPW